MEVIDIKALTQTTQKKPYFDGRPCFSPDGKTVLFERNGNGIKLVWAQHISKHISQIYIGTIIM